MRHNHHALSVISVLALGAAFTQTAWANTVASADRAAIQKLLESWNDARNKGDAQSMAALFAPDHRQHALAEYASKPGGIVKIQIRSIESLGQDRVRVRYSRSWGGSRPGNMSGNIDVLKVGTSWQLLSSQKRPPKVNQPLVAAPSNARTLERVSPNVTAAPSKPVTGSEEAELLNRQLEAQREINRQMARRLQDVERQLSAAGKTPELALNASAPPPAASLQDIDSQAAASALEQALGSRGLTLMPPGAYRLTPSLGWSHSGSAQTKSDTYALGMGLDAGLPAGFMASARVPYISRSTPIGKNQGMGDATFALSKRLTSETALIPSLVAKLSYTQDSGQKAFEPVSVSGGFKAYGFSLSTLKRFDPVVVYGDLSYGRALEKSVSINYPDGSQFVGKIKPAAGYGISLGVSLAATPEVSLDAGFSTNIGGKARLSPTIGPVVETPRSTASYLTFGTGIVLTRNLLLSVSAGAGISQDASDFVFSISLPYKF